MGATNPIPENERIRLVELAAPIYARVGRKWDLMATELRQHWPTITAAALREWHRHNMSGARDKWEAAAGETREEDVSRVWGKTRDVFVREVEALVDGGVVAAILQKSPPKGLKLIRDIGATCRDYGGHLDAPEVPTDKPDEGKVVSIEERLERLKKGAG